MNAAKLKPCPFCGGTATTYPRTCNKDTKYNPADRAFPIVRCTQCFAEVCGKDWGEPATAIAAWNRRSSAAPVMLAALREALPFVESQEDVRDGGDGQQLPNEAMVLAQVLRAAIAAATGEQS